MYLDVEALTRVDKVANETIRAQAQQLVALTNEVERLRDLLEKASDCNC